MHSLELVCWMLWQRAEAAEHHERWTFPQHKHGGWEHTMSHVSGRLTVSSTVTPHAVTPHAVTPHAVNPRPRKSVCIGTDSDNTDSLVLVYLALQPVSK
jgi:hypothetical protein